MNQQTFDSAYAAYQVGDWANAASLFEQSKAPGEVAARIDHLRGNALMKLGRYSDAADAYAGALADPTYGMVGALNTNRGRALLAAGRIQEAAQALSSATEDSSYATPYKAYMALGSAYRAMGDVRGAGIAYRNAAIDEANPDPSTSLRKLGGCFMDLGRPADAVESYRTALDFCGGSDAQASIYCDLALAYVAANRMNEAVDAFEHATAGGSPLSPEAQAAYDAARNAVSARTGANRASDTDNLLAAAGYGSYTDPLDPTGATSGNLMPSPEDTGFFSVSEDEIVDNDRRSRRKGGAGKVFAVLLVLLLIIGGGLGFAYYSGFGWPTQENVATELFAAKTRGEDVTKYVSPALDDATRQQISTLVPSDATVSVGGVTRSMRDSEVSVTAKLSQGGEQSYRISMVRDGIGWKVSGFDLEYHSNQGTPALDTANTSNATNATQQPAQQPAATQPAEQAPAEQPAEQAPAEQPAEAAPEGQPSDDATVSAGEVTV